jgi:hypothetical protein
MKANLKVILSVVGIAALLASPAMAKQRPAKLLVVPSDARASVAPYGSNEGGPYRPSMPASRYNTDRDFQNGSRG